MLTQMLKTKSYSDQDEGKKQKYGCNLEIVRVIISIVADFFFD